MKKMYAFLKKIGADYKKEKCGDNYFFNAPGIEFDSAIVSFEFSDFYTVSRWRALEKRIEHYADRYGYKIFNRGGCLGAAWFFVARASDLERYSDYRSFMDNCVAECEQIMHKHYIGAAVVDDLNAELRHVMDEYGNCYNEFLKAVKTA